ncbi:MAG: HD-GYP domain-containing protein [Spirochaetaceae bacterium]|nr:HD-GYP domain-containing protein [Spirochaetaceae bacterium]GMO29567.1 MAG: HD-GYP domain-containing protein [Termitinemataceae bacterium]
MNLIAVSKLACGQRYSKPVYIDGESLLVEAEIPLQKRDLDLLASLGVTHVQTDGEPLSPDGSPLKESDNTESQLSSSLEAGAVSKLLGNLIKQLDGILRETVIKKENKEKKHSVRQLWAISSVLLKIVKDERASCLGFVLSGAYNTYHIAKSAINTAILSIVMAREMGMALERIPEVAAGALLHDIGMLRLPPEITGKAGELSAEEAALICSHTTLSYNIITRELAYSPSVGTIALQHHERWDGTGYPQRLVGSAIDAGARIVCIADAFEAMICEKPYRNPMIGYIAMKNIVSENAAHFAPATLKVFLRVIGMYPIGSGVTLSDGRIARVIDVHPDVPLRPVVQIIAELGAKRVKEAEKIDLLNQKQLFITQALDISSFEN